MEMITVKERTQKEFFVRDHLPPALIAANDKIKEVKYDLDCGLLIPGATIENPSEYVAVVYNDDSVMVVEVTHDNLQALMLDVLIRL